MRIVSGHIVPLGYGKFVRSDRVTALQPIEDGRGRGRRTLVYVDDVAEPLVASRSDAAIVRDLAEPVSEGGEAQQLRQLLGDILETIDRLEPMIRSIIRDQAGWNLDRLEERIREALGEES
ncbi:MAG: hypothetical protein P8099_13790 [Gemmatimonadota bacterium]